MSKPIIEVINLSKKFKIGKQSADLRQTIRGFFSGSKENVAEIWALKDISFTLGEGEVLGLIGPNGSGKSTLLKILSKITYPTSGKAILRGRVSSLLEVGTGFHPELTGRENIFLNGSILGMTRAEIKSKFDEIVDFSGVEPFIDTPVKHFSSGMYVRLAFSVAAHLEPEILLVDEVLSVGDLAFRQKSMGKMNEVAGRGRTVIFVSHNLDSIQNICFSGLLLDFGKLIKQGDISNVINIYKNLVSLPDNDFNFETGNDDLMIEGFELFDTIGKKTNVVSSGDEIWIAIKINSVYHIERINLRIEFKDEDGNFLFTCNNFLTGEIFNLNKGLNTFNCFIPKIPLNIGKYFIDFAIGIRGNTIFRQRNIMKFEILNGSFYKSGNLPSKDKRILLNFEWH